MVNNTVTFSNGVTGTVLSALTRDVQVQFGRR
jgi:hypothetical protein